MEVIVLLKRIFYVHRNLNIYFFRSYLFFENRRNFANIKEFSMREECGLFMGCSLWSEDPWLGGVVAWNLEENS